MLPGDASPDKPNPKPPKKKGFFRVIHVDNTSEDEWGTIEFVGRRPTLNLLQAVVGGSIESVPTDMPNYILVCNESGKLMNMPVNKMATALLGGMGSETSGCGFGNLNGPVILINKKYM
jgi:hypothetical protein